MIQKDTSPNGRYQLSSREYAALRTVFGAVNAYSTCGGELKNRASLFSGGWRDMRMLEERSKTLLEKLMKTIPQNQLYTLSRELRQTICEVKVKPVSMPKDSGLILVSQDALLRLVDRAVQMDCMFCEKNCKEGRKCQLYQDVQACFPYEFSPSKDDKCPLAGVTGV